ncbi:uncharacterized protein FOMMEDRAFT_77202, partial [Fomitiporia mediterranea MF3/22]|uniref:uncharacterized protein n=1 Tax=Fomitiporia mediterranea (strain MF3/22) TaxID=694068 RepID=UPI000440960E
TLCVLSVVDRMLLPFQQVCSRRTEQSTLSKSKACTLGFDFTFTTTEKKQESYYSTLKIMKEVSTISFVLLFF